MIEIEYIINYGGIEDDGLNARQSAIKKRADMRNIRTSMGGVFAKAWNDYIKEISL